MSARLLVIEDDDHVRLMLRMMLEDEGYQVSEAGTAEGGLIRFETDRPDMVLVDLKLPDRSGFDICRSLRQTTDVPIIIVTAQESSYDVVAGLEAGADDYVKKPFVPKELAARIRALLRRAQTATPETSSSAPAQRYTFADLDIRPDQGTVRKNGQELHLTRTEFRLLCEFAANPGRVYSRELLLEKVWGYDYLGDGRLVDAHIRRLRTKVEDDPARPNHILTVRGLGYKFAM